MNDSVHWETNEYGIEHVTLQIDHMDFKMLEDVISFCHKEKLRCYIKPVDNSIFKLDVFKADLNDKSNLMEIHDDLIKIFPKIELEFAALNNWD